jgi:hypothetical protein
MHPVKSLLPLLALIALVLATSSSSAQEKAKKPYVLYAEFVTDSPVELSDGAQWMMEKGDCFPIHMFKQQQTKVVLQLANASFMTETYKVRILKEAEEARAKASYQKMVDSYLKSKVRDLKLDEATKKGN